MCARDQNAAGSVSQCALPLAPLQFLGGVEPQPPPWSVFPTEGHPPRRRIEAIPSWTARGYPPHRQLEGIPLTDRKRVSPSRTERGYPPHGYLGRHCPHKKPRAQKLTPNREQNRGQNRGQNCSLLPGGWRHTPHGTEPFMRHGNLPEDWVIRNVVF